MQAKLTSDLLRRAAGRLKPWPRDNAKHGRFMCHAVAVEAGIPQPKDACFAPHHKFDDLLTSHGVSLCGSLDFRAADGAYGMVPFGREQQEVRFMFLHLLAESMS